MRGKLIVFEGIDGSGKETQSKALLAKLEKEGRKVRHISFPNYESDSSALVKMYLSGKFGKDPEDVNAYTASLFYAVDRFASYKMDWKSFYDEGGIILCDRYTTSNMVHQMTKIEDEGKRKEFLAWLEMTEYEKMGLPKPDVVILLDLPLEVSQRLVKERAKQGGSMDIHESHLNYLKKCSDAYQELLAHYGWEKVSCMKGKTLRSIEDINQEVYEKVKAYL